MESTENYIDLMVCNPQSTTESDHYSTISRKYTTYEIRIKTDNQMFSLIESSVRRRYSEFCWLQKRLKEHHPSVNPPVLPPKTVLRSFDHIFISNRCQALQTFLQQCLKETLYLSDTTFHLFVQTPMMCCNIDAYMKGEITHQYVKSIVSMLAAEVECDLSSPNTSHNNSTMDDSVDSSTESSSESFDRGSDNSSSVAHSV